MIRLLKWRIARLIRTIDRLVARTAARNEELAQLKARLTALLSKD